MSQIEGQWQAVRHDWLPGPSVRHRRFEHRAIVSRDIVDIDTTPVACIVGDTYEGENVILKKTHKANQTCPLLAIVL